MRPAWILRRRDRRFHSSTVLAVTLALLIGAALPGVGHADIVGGVEINGPAPAPITGAPRSNPRTMVTQIDFDDAHQPCLFLETNPLRDAYAAQGVLFSGRGPLAGGAILNECGNFGVVGHSSPNFLAFNSTAMMQNGGIPESPERLTFPGGSVVAVEMSIGSGGGGTVTVTAYNALHEVVDSDGGALVSAMQIFSVTGTQIAEVEVVATNQVFPGFGWVIDDLAFSTDPTAARPATWGHVKTIYR